MDVQRLIALRAQKDAFFADHPQSPLTEAQKAAFTGLTYYVPRANLNMTLTLHPFEKKDNIQINTTQGIPRWFMRAGEFRFTVGKQEVRLTLYRTPDYLFLPFVDANAGTETYPAGRYLEPAPLDDTLYQVDFNQAYNPYCAYNPRYDCPLTPPENRLEVAIPAGEKLPEGDWVRLAFDSTDAHP